MKKLVKDSWNAVRPQTRTGHGAQLTARDGSNVFLTGAITTVLTWVVHDILGAPITPEVAAALSTLLVYAAARKLRY